MKAVVEMGQNAPDHGELALNNDKLILAQLHDLINIYGSPEALSDVLKPNVVSSTAIRHWLAKDHIAEGSKQHVTALHEKVYSEGIIYSAASYRDTSGKGYYKDFKPQRTTSLQVLGENMYNFSLSSYLYGEAKTATTKGQMVAYRRATDNIVGHGNLIFIDVDNKVKNAEGDYAKAKGDDFLTVKKLRAALESLNLKAVITYSKSAKPEWLKFHVAIIVNHVGDHETFTARYLTFIEMLGLSECKGLDTTMKSAVQNIAPSRNPDRKEQLVEVVEGKAFMFSELEPSQTASVNSDMKVTPLADLPDLHLREENSGKKHTVESLIAGLKVAPNNKIRMECFNGHEHDGRNDAAFARLTESGNAFIHCMACGEKVVLAEGGYTDAEISAAFDELGDDPFEDEVDSMTQYATFVKTHKLLFHGSNVLFVNQDKAVFKADKKASKKDEWANRLQLVGTTSKGVPIYKNVVDIAIHGYGKRFRPMKRYTDVEFAPDGKIDDDVVNLWRGFPVEPKKGDITPFVEFLNKICKGDAAAPKNTLDWFADMMQNPHRKVLWALAFHGPKGSGKNTIVLMLGEKLLHTSNYIAVVNKEHLFGRFTGHLATNLLTVANELVWGGDHAHDSAIKTLITEQTRMLEKKGVDAFTLKNYTRLYINSNAEWVVPASGKDERRYYVVKTEKISEADMKALYDWYDNKGGKEALMYEMLNRDLSDFDHTKAPWNINLSDQQSKSLHGIELFCHNAILDGEFDNSDYGASITKDHLIGASELFKTYVSKHGNAANKLTQTRFGKDVKRLFGITETKRPNGRTTMYVMPLRHEAAAAFEKETGVKIDVDFTDEWLDTLDEEYEDDKL